MPSRFSVWATGVGLEGPLWDVLPGSGEVERDRQAEGAGQAQGMGESEVITPWPGAGPRVPRQTIPWLHLEAGPDLGGQPVPQMPPLPLPGPAQGRA